MLALGIFLGVPRCTVARESPAAEAAVADSGSTHTVRAVAGVTDTAVAHSATIDSSGIVPTAELPSDSVATSTELGWLEILQRLDFPRENKAELDRAREVLAAALLSAGLAPRALPFDSRRGRPALAAILWIAAAALLGWGCIAGSWKGVAAAAAAASLGLLGLAGGLDAVLPVTQAANLDVVIEPRGPAQCEVLLGAHYDSKTELFDHVERGLGIAVTAWAAVVGFCVGFWRRRAARILGGVAAVGLALGGVHLGSGLVLGARSHGIIDDAAACALLVEQARQLHGLPLESTRVRCVWWAAEERGAQGSREFVRATGLRPDAVVNLECLGAGPRPGVLGIEWTGARLEPPQLDLVTALQRAAPQRLTRLPAPAVTDAGPWLAIDVPAVTLVNLRANGLPARHLHGPGDRLEALDRGGVEAVGAILRSWLTQVDARRP